MKTTRHTMADGTVVNPMGLHISRKVLAMLVALCNGEAVVWTGKVRRILQGAGFVGADDRPTATGRYVAGA